MKAYVQVRVTQSMRDQVSSYIKTANDFCGNFNRDHRHKCLEVRKGWSGNEYEAYNLTNVTVPSGIFMWEGRPSRNALFKKINSLHAMILNAETILLDQEAYNALECAVSDIECEPVVTARVKEQQQ